MHTPSFAEYTACIDRDDWRAVGEIMLASANKLAACGADFLCPGCRVGNQGRRSRKNCERPHIFCAFVRTARPATKRRLPPTVEPEMVHQVIGDDIKVIIGNPRPLGYHRIDLRFPLFSCVPRPCHDFEGVAL